MRIDLLDYLPNDIVVEVPGNVNKDGVKGIRLENYPSSFGSLLNNQASTIQLTTDAIIIPINPIIKNEPNLVRSLFVV